MMPPYFDTTLKTFQETPNTASKYIMVQRYYVNAKITIHNTCKESQAELMLNYLLHILNTSSHRCGPMGKIPHGRKMIFSSSYILIANPQFVTLSPL